ncbi:MAG: hypothetical protein NC300_05685 [Bacteroidales bacterium]|nr:hypothetical protein [Clostridium sp.]MCM1203614.1 hypothetical protein [Bacteroidales bacterium]
MVVEMEISFKFSRNLIKRNLKKGEFGLEKESLRVDGDGFLSHTKHPFEEQNNITRDFCENQIELITDVFDNVHSMMQHLEQLQIRVLETLQKLETGKEYLWPFSNPPYVRGDWDIPIAQFKGELKKKTQYRNYLAEKYGKGIMLFSGIHLNYSFADEMLREGYLEVLSGAGKKRLREEEFTYSMYKNQVYLQLAQKVLQYSWFIVYLTAASPVMDISILDGGKNFTGRGNERNVENVHNISKQKAWKKEDLVKYASVRCGEQGYWNDFTPVLDYQNLENYLQSIEAYVQKGKLQSASELYYPVRVKPRGENSLMRLRKRGINHIELRMLDVNPLSPVGLMEEDVEFLHYFLLYLMHTDDVLLTKEEQVEAIMNEQQAAKFDDSRITIKKSDGGSQQIRKAALEILKDMEEFYALFDKPRCLKSIGYQREKLLIPDNRYADRIRKEYEVDYVMRGIALADEYAGELLAKQNVNELLRKRCV